MSILFTAFSSNPNDYVTNFSQGPQIKNQEKHPTTAASIIKDVTLHPITPYALPEISK